jgi:hypothetical protein
MRAGRSGTAFTVFLPLGKAGAGDTATSAEAARPLAGITE